MYKRRSSLLAIGFAAAIAVVGCSKPTPSVTVSDQADNNDSVTIAKVVSNGPGWLVIHKDASGAPGAVIGYAAVKNGENDNVVVKIDSYSGSPTLYAMLHIDAGKVGVYQFPGPDVPVMVDGKMVSPPFKVTGLDPRVVVADQAIKDGTVTIAEVLSNGPGWLVVHADAKGAPGPVIGHVAAPDGLNLNLVVPINAKKATPVLYAMLHIDTKVGVYQFPGPDVPVMVDGKMVSPPFKASK